MVTKKELEQLRETYYENKINRLEKKYKKELNIIEQEFMSASANGESICEFRIFSDIEGKTVREIGNSIINVMAYEWNDIIEILDNYGYVLNFSSFESFFDLR